MLDGDRPIALPTPNKVFALWSYLLLNRHQPLPRDRVAFTLWPDVPEPEARANLRRHLHQLNKQLPKASPDLPWILATRTTLQWNPDAAYWLDVALLEDLDETNADPARWPAVMDAYRGALLENLYDDWVLTEREHLHQHFVRLCEVQIDRQRAAGDLQGAIATARHLLIHEPLREEPYRYLMECYYRLGDRAAALREFERCEEMLRAELDAEPMPETLALRDEILAGETWTPLPAPVPQVPQPDCPLPTSKVQARPTNLAAARSAAPSLLRRFRGWMLAGVALILLALAGLLLKGAFSPAEPVTTSISGPGVVEDTWLNGETPGLNYDPDYPGDPYAIYPQVHLAYWNYPYDRVLIRFDLRDIPADASIEQAALCIQLESFLNEDLPEPLPATVSAFRLRTPWQAASATFDQPWSQPGLAPGTDYAPEPLGSDSLLGTDWISIDVTDAVRAWLQNPDENFGLLVMITEAPQGAHYWVNMTDYPFSTHRPWLDVTYRP